VHSKKVALESKCLFQISLKLIVLAVIGRAMTLELDFEDKPLQQLRWKA